MIYYIFILHFVADFMLQSRRVARNKSKDVSALAEHIIIIHIVMTVGLFLWGAETVFCLLFPVFNSIFHAACDWSIWRGYALTIRLRRSKYLRRFGLLPKLNTVNNKREYPYYRDSWFYATIGLDQLIHYVTIVYLYQVLL